MGRDLTVGRWVRDRARVAPDDIAIESPGATTTYGELDTRSDRLAAALLASGLQPGDRVSTLTQNSAEHVEVLFACAKAGLAMVPTSWRLTPPEVAFQLDDATPAALLVDPACGRLADEALAIASTRPARHELSRLGLDALAADHPADPLALAADEDPLLLIYTSGTTGRPKGAILTHANTFWTNLAFDRVVDVRDEDVVLQVLPQFHVGGWNVLSMLAWWKGAAVVLPPVFDAAEALASIADRRVTAMLGVPATYLFLAELDDFPTADLTSLRHAVVGGAPMPESLLRQWHARGVEVTQGYGLTEAAPNVLCLPPAQATRHVGAAGIPYPWVEVELRAPSGATIEGPGRGELLVRGPNVFAGYWGRAEDTAASFTADGWLRTGDVAERDAEGFYRIRDRIKDMFISGGENVYPAEVEAVLHEHPAVLDAAVVGVPDERWGEVGLAVVVARPGAPVTAQDLVTSTAADRLARYKVPTRVAFRRRAAALDGGQGPATAVASPSTGAGASDRDQWVWTRRRRPRSVGTDGRCCRPGASARAAACWRLPRRSSPSSATTTRRS